MPDAYARLYDVLSLSEAKASRDCAVCSFAEAAWLGGFFSARIGSGPSQIIREWSVDTDGIGPYRQGVLRIRRGRPPQLGYAVRSAFVSSRISKKNLMSPSACFTTMRMDAADFERCDAAAITRGGPNFPIGSQSLYIPTRSGDEDAENSVDKSQTAAFVF